MLRFTGVQTPSKIIINATFGRPLRSRDSMPAVYTVQYTLFIILFVFIASCSHIYSKWKEYKNKIYMIIYRSSAYIQLYPYIEV